MRAKNLFIDTLNGLSEDIRSLSPILLYLPQPLIQPLILDHLTLVIRFLLRLLVIFSRQIYSELLVLCAIIPQIVLISSDVVLDVLQVQLHLPLVPLVPLVPHAETENQAKADSDSKRRKKAELQEDYTSRVRTIHLVLFRRRPCTAVAVPCRHCTLPWLHRTTRPCTAGAFTAEPSPCGSAVLSPYCSFTAGAWQRVRCVQPVRHRASVRRQPQEPKRKARG